MENSTTYAGKLKEVFKQATIEAMEDLGMIRAIQRGEESETDSRDEVPNATQL